MSGRLVGGEFVQLVVEQRQELRRGVRVASFNLGKGAACPVHYSALFGPLLCHQDVSFKLLISH